MFKRLSVVAALFGLVASLLPMAAGTVSATTPGSIQGQDGGWSGGTIPISAKVDQAVDQSGGAAHTGVGSWRISNSTAHGNANGSLAGWPFGPGLSMSAGSPGDANQFNATFWFRSASSVADGSNVEVDLGTPAGDDRTTSLAITNRADSDGGLQLRATESDATLPPDYFWPTVVIKRGISRNAWHRIDIVASFSPGPNNDTFQVSLDGVPLANPRTGGATFLTLEGYREGKGYSYALSNRLFWRSDAAPSAFGTFLPAAKGFFFDDVRYSVQDSMDISANTGYADGFEPACSTVCYVDGRFGSDANAGDANGPKKTVKAGVTAVSTGGTLHVAAAGYAEDITIGKPLVLLGAQAGNAVAGRTVPWLEAMILGLNPNGNIATLTINAAHVTIDGFTIGTSGPVHGAAIAILVNSGGSGAVIRNNIIDSVLSYDPAPTGTAQAVYLSNGPDNVQVVGNRMTKITSAGTARGVLIGDGVLVGGSAFPNPSTGVLIDGNTISDVTSTAGSAYGIQLNSGNAVTSNAGLVIRYNTITNLTGAGSAFAAFGVRAIGIEADAPGVQIHHNTISGLVAPPSADRVAVWFGNKDTSFSSAVVNQNSLDVGASASGIAVHPALGSGSAAGTCNWWGSASGPGPVGPGSGSHVSTKVSFTPWLLTSDLDGTCIDSTAKGFTTKALADLAAIPAIDRKTDKLVADAMADIRSSLGRLNWVDRSHLDGKHAMRVFVDEKHAVRSLKDIAGTMPAGATQAINDLLTADRLLAQTAINDAKATAGFDPKKIAEANREMAKARQEIARGHFDLAIDHYRSAWKDAQKA